MAQRTGTAELPLHNGKAPRWLFERMVKLAGGITEVIVSDFGPEEFLRRLSDPYWFQAFGCVLGFDWHSSGLTTTVCGALKEALLATGGQLCLYAAGGKGACSRRTPEEIERWSERVGMNPEGLVYSSRMSAKVDSAAVQDGYQIYHHSFIFTNDGKWAVVQQGMNPSNRLARRYHWLGESVNDFVCEPHNAVCCDFQGETLNMVAGESAGAREVSVAVSKEGTEKVHHELSRMQELKLPRRHEILVSDINPDRLKSAFCSIYETQPQNYEELLGIKGVGPKTIRALALVSELIYGEAPSRKDPARYSFAHGGKDGYPYPVDRTVYDSSISYLADAVKHTKVGRSEKIEALKRLSSLAKI